MTGPPCEPPGNGFGRTVDPKHTILVETCYRQPDTKGKYGENFWDKLQLSYDLAKATGIPNIIITGDLNADAQTDRRAKTSLDFFLETNHLFQHITEPTRITPTRATILDLIITNDKDLVSTTAELKFVVNRTKSYNRTM